MATLSVSNRKRPVPFIVQYVEARRGFRIRAVPPRNGADARIRMIPTWVGGNRTVQTQAVAA